MCQRGSHREKGYFEESLRINGQVPPELVVGWRGEMLRCPGPAQPQLLGLREGEGWLKCLLWSNRSNCRRHVPSLVGGSKRIPYLSQTRRPDGRSPTTAQLLFLKHRLMKYVLASQGRRTAEPGVAFFARMFCSMCGIVKESKAEAAPGASRTASGLGSGFDVRPRGFPEPPSRPVPSRESSAGVQRAARSLGSAAQGDWKPGNHPSFQRGAWL